MGLRFRHAVEFVNAALSRIALSDLLGGRFWLSSSHLSLIFESFPLFSGQRRVFRRISRAGRKPFIRLSLWRVTLGVVNQKLWVQHSLLRRFPISRIFV
jgi:hypothetical protein